MSTTRQIHSMSDFLRNHKAHVARLKEMRMPEVLTVNGRAEVVVLDAESYQELTERANNQDTVAIVRADFARAAGDASKVDGEIRRRDAILDEIVALSEEMGLYQ